MPSAKINPALYFNDEDKINEILADLSVPIVALGLPSTIFTAQQCLEAFLMSKQYIKRVKFVSCYAEMGVLENALNAGITKGLISSPQDCTAHEFAKWARWLNTTEGQQIIHDAQLTKKLKKSVAEGETVEQVAVFKAFCMMRQDYGVAVKRAKRDEIMKISNHYGPVLAYLAPGKEEIDAAAYELYAAEAKAKGYEALERKLFKSGIIGVDKYEYKAYGADEKRHANNVIYRKDIEAYLARKIVEFRATDTFDKKGEKKVCHLLGIISGKEAVNDAIAASEKASRKRTRTE